MAPSETLNDEPVRRVSVLGRLVPAFSYGVTAPACIASVLVLFGVMATFRYGESPGIGAVAVGMAEATRPTLMALYFAIAVGLIGIVLFIFRLFTKNATASPSALFFLIAGFIGLAPLLLLWQAQSVFIQAIAPGGGAIAPGASNIQRWLVLTIVVAVLAILILMIGSLAPLPRLMRARRGYASLLVLLLMELAFIGMAVAFQVRLGWLQQVRFTERF